MVAAGEGVRKQAVAQSREHEESASLPGLRTKGLDALDEPIDEEGADEATDAAETEEVAASLYLTRYTLDVELVTI
jgi:hypothetical protein